MEKLKNSANPLDCFLLFFDDILKLICSESNQFNQFTSSTIMLYIGCLLCMGLVQLPEKKIHWNQEEFFPCDVKR